jgi:hypothetical protein
MVAFPSRILNNTYVSCKFDQIFIAVSAPHFTYLTLSEMELSLCGGDEIKYCPANKAVSSSMTDSCIINLYLNSQNAPEVCPR